jgi:hypothetical protein
MLLCFVSQLGRPEEWQYDADILLREMSLYVV